MTIRKIASIGHPVLRQTARTLTLEELASAEMQRFIDDLVETMRDANGAGLAANQVYEPIAICALEVNSNPRYPYKPDIPLTVLVNPTIQVVGDETFDNYEGCLSIPNLRGIVERNARIVISAWDRHGESLERQVAGITAGTYQHEVDHLLGTLFLDRVSDPHTLCTWGEFNRHYREAFAASAEAIVARYGS